MIQSPTPSTPRSPAPRDGRVRRSSGAIAVLAAGSLLLAGCSSAASDSAGATDGPMASASATAAAYDPVTVDNCGTELTLESAPQRIVTIKSSTEEMLLALGLGDRIVGTAFSDGPVPEQWAEEAAGIPVLAETVPSQEALLAAEPDLVYAGWESNLTAKGAGDRAALAALGVSGYVSPSACKAEGYQPAKLDFDDVFGEIEEAGGVFGAVDAASDLVAEQRAALDDVVPVEGAPTAVWYSSGSDTPYVGAGIGAPQLILESAGFTNIAADVQDTWSSLNWEVVVAADPDVIVLVDASWNTAEDKIAVLEANPATAALPAVVDSRYIVVPFAASEAGVRTAGAVGSVVEQYEALAG